MGHHFAMQDTNDLLMRMEVAAQIQHQETKPANKVGFGAAAIAPSGSTISTSGRDERSHHHKEGSIASGITSMFSSAIGGAEKSVHHGAERSVHRNKHKDGDGEHRQHHHHRHHRGSRHKRRESNAALIGNLDPELARKVSSVLDRRRSTQINGVKRGSVEGMNQLVNVAAADLNNAIIPKMEVNSFISKISGLSPIMGSPSTIQKRKIKAERSTKERKTSTRKERTSPEKSQLPASPTHNPKPASVLRSPNSDKVRDETSRDELNKTIAVIF